MPRNQRWSLITLGTIAEFRNGINFSKENFGTGIKVIGVSDFQNNVRATFDNLEQINPQGVVRKEHLLKNGDVLFVRSNGNRELVGRSMFVEGLQENVTHSAFSIRLRFVSDDCHPRFYAYLFRSPLIRQALSLHGGGTNISNLNQDILGRLEVPLPPKAVQCKIASVLSAFDDLIDNNARRIRILESMAQMTYREWFVNLRFPGHGKVSTVDSELGPIPRGWTIKEMQEVADVVDCLHSKKPDSCEGGYGLLLQLFNIGENGKIDLSKKYLISEADYTLWTSRIEVSAGDCVITNVGRIAAVAQIPEGLKAAAGRNMTAVRPRAGLMTPTLLIEYLLSPHMESEVRKKKDAGTIMDSLNVKGIVRLCVPIPPASLILEFERFVRPMRRQIELLTEQNLNLLRTRDSLLPKVIFGHIAVEQLETEAVVQNV